MRTPTKRNHSVLASESHAENRSFLGIPLELRLQIYDYFFHEDIKNCLPNQVMGCHCGEPVTRISRQIYRESRPIYYQRGRFVLRRSEKCFKFLNAIGNNIINLRDFGIQITNDYVECMNVLRALDKFSIAGHLSHLQINIQSDASRLTFRGPIADDPIYWPTTKEKSAAIAYDMEFRPTKQNIGNLKSLRSLLVCGRPGASELEEFIYRLRNSISSTGRKEKVPVVISNCKTSSHVWLYRIEVGAGTSGEVNPEISLASFKF
ncbi:hypothetical protein BGZ60DRAFT_397827 [Tricladium varicosporioides]|nr:hypothetical protein BGZ60DRAFT_397827 [Hymenoscyphus varicosporioides]